MSAHFARDEEVTAWREDGWVLLDGLIGTDEIDDATVDLREVFPTPEQYHPDPVGETTTPIPRTHPGEQPARSPRSLFARSPRRPIDATRITTYTMARKARTEPALGNQRRTGWSPSGTCRAAEAREELWIRR